MLTVTIGDWKQVAVFESTKKRHCDPTILVLFVRVAWWNSCFSRKGKLSHTVGVHLLRVAAIVGILGDLSWRICGFWFAWNLLSFLIVFLITMVSHVSNRFSWGLVELVVGLLNIQSLLVLICQVGRIIWIYEFNHIFARNMLCRNSKWLEFCESIRNFWEW